MKNIVEFCGVPLVRVIKREKLWYVQQRENEASKDWSDVGDPCETKDEALDVAPERCEF
jgi:hypothetical protein